MPRLATFFVVASALSSPLLTSAWTFTWRNASDTPTVEEGTGAQACTEINHVKGKYFEFDAEDSLVRIYMYGDSDCSDDPEGRADHYLAHHSSGPIRGFKVVDRSNSSRDNDDSDSDGGSGSGLTPFPGADWFKTSPNSPIITAMGERLVDEGCGNYTVGPGPQWTTADQASYKCWQEKLGYTGSDADGWPGQTTWDELKVPQTGSGSGDSTTTTETPTPTPTSTNTGSGSETPTSTSEPDADTSSGSSSLSGGAIAGIVVGIVIGLGLIGAIIYLARRVRRPSTPPAAGAGASAGEAEPELERGGPGLGPGPGPGPGEGEGERERRGDGAALAGLAAAEESKKSSLDKLPAEAEAIPAKNPPQQPQPEPKHFAELAGDMGTVELSDSRRINEMEDSSRAAPLK